MIRLRFAVINGSKETTVFEDLSSAVDLVNLPQLKSKRIHHGIGGDNGVLELRKF